MPLAKQVGTALLIIAFAGPNARAGQAAQKPAIRVRVEVVSVDVGVTDVQGRFVTDLPEDAFHVFDDGREQPLTYFAPTEAPAQVLLFIEAGPAVYLLEGEHLRAAYAFLESLAPDDRVALASYADKAESVLGFTTDKGMVSAALEGLHFNLGMGDLNLADALESPVAWPSAGKRSIVLLSTGVDTSAPEHGRRLLERLRAGDVTVYAVALGGILREPTVPGNKRNSPGGTSSVSFEEADRALKEIAEVSGGRAFFPRSPQEFQAAYRQIGALVRHQYSLGFAPAEHDGRAHQIEVHVGASPAGLSGAKAAPIYRLDYRRAYVALSEPPR
jgi:Ca-activated chloride channel family protein